MSDNSVNIGSKSIVWILVFTLIIVILIVFFSKIDNRKRYNQFKSINEKIINSEYPERFENLIKDFSIVDTSLIMMIEQNLSLLHEDFPEINYAEIYIKDTCCYYQISNEQFFNDSKIVSEIKFLPQNLKKSIDYLNSADKPDIDSLYRMTKNNSNLDLIMKVGEGYLLIRHVRN